MKRAAVVALFLMVGTSCSSTPSPALPTGQPTDRTPEAPPLAEGTYAEGQLDEIPVFTSPDADSFVVAIVSEGQGLTEWETAEVDGTQWHRVQVQTTLGRLEAAYGWVPAAIGGESTIAPAARACPQELSISSLGVLEPEHRRRCAGNRELTLSGTLVLFDPAPLYEGEPGWLAEESPWRISAAAGPAVEGGALSIHVPTRTLAARHRAWRPA